MDIIYEIFLILISLFFFLLILMFLSSFLVYHYAFKNRIEYNDDVKYYKEEDFEGITSTPITFNTSKKKKINGKIFEKGKKSKGLIVLCHGIGPGYYAYGCEINYFVNNGFKVVAYDNSGCGSSEGKSINGLPQSIIDLFHCLRYIENDNILKKEKIILYGHSLGAYSVCNVIRLFKRRIFGIVALAPFNNSSSLIAERLKGVGEMFKPFINFWDNKRFGYIANFQTVYSLKESNTKTLVVYSKNDEMLGYENNFAKYEKELVTNPKITLKRFDSKMHRPNISDNAVQYDAKRNNDYLLLKKKYHNKIPKEILKEYFTNLDYQLLVEFDNQVMQTIMDFINECVD